MQTFPCPEPSTASPVPDGRAAERAPQKIGLALAIAGAAFDVAPEELRADGRRSAPVAEARHVAIYLAHVVFQLPMHVVADAFGRDRTSVGHAVRRVEDRRDNAGFDQLMERLERLATFCSRPERATTRATTQAAARENRP